MPRKSSGHDSRVITYSTLPRSSTRYRRVNVGECTAWVQTNLEFDLDVQHPDETTETKPYVLSPALARGWGGEKLGLHRLDVHPVSIDDGL